MQGVNERIAIGWIDPEQVSGWFAQSVAAAARDLEYFGSAGKILRQTAAQPIDARNNLVRTFLEETDDDWLWMIDADMTFDKGHVMKLWTAAFDHDVKIASGLAFIWRPEGPVPSTFYQKDDGSMWIPYDYIPEESSPVDATGLASLLVHRDVFEAMQGGRHPRNRWFDFYLNDEVGITGDAMTGIDVAFCLRARELGFPMVLEPNAKTKHLETIFIDQDRWEQVWKES
jgi:hypothetical protein